MRKLLLFIIPIFILACSEDKDVKVYKPAPTISTRSGTWSIAGGKDTYVLGEQLGVRISSGGNISPNIHSAVLEMKTGNNSHYMTISSGEHADLDFSRLYASHLGTCYIRGTVFLWEDGKLTPVETEVYEFRVMGPHIKNLMEMDDFKRRMNECWDDSKASEKAKLRCEFGFVLQMDTDSEKGSTYSFVDGKATPSNDCATGAVNTIIFPIVDEENSASSSHSVALFHTHPPLTNCPHTSGRPTGPSKEDDETANDKMIPSVIWDYGDKNKWIYGGHDRNSSPVQSYAGSYVQRL